MGSVLCSFAPSPVRTVYSVMEAGSHLSSGSAQDEPERVLRP